VVTVVSKGKGPPAQCLEFVVAAPHATSRRLVARLRRHAEDGLAVNPIRLNRTMCHSLGAHVRRKTLQSALQVLQVLLHATHSRSPFPFQLANGSSAKRIGGRSLWLCALVSDDIYIIIGYYRI
jgi:hypothetical protein